MEAIKDYQSKLATARKIKEKFSDVFHVIVERNFRKFRTATKFPAVVYEHRNFHELGEWYIVVTAESKSRFRSGIIGISAFQMLYDDNKNVIGVFLVEGDDDGHTFIEEFNRNFLDDYVDSHDMEVVNGSYVPVFMKFYKENFFSTRKDLGGFLVMADDEGREHRIVPFIMATPAGVALGFTNEHHEGHMYVQYKPAEEYFAGDQAAIEEISDRVLNLWNDMEKNPWKYSPLKNLVES